ncbi:MAG: ClpXP protease specificity-enhancing factor [Betaproteobacteria bacterium]|nr:ClpXP protease specificity-enhancing factor [Betaproteobacteria bacterium]
MAERSTKPYLIRAIHEWCSDSGLTPYITVHVSDAVRVPMEYVKNGEILLNVSNDATHRLTIGNELIQFSARFNGVSRECSIPLEAVTGVFAKENGQGLFFPRETAPNGAAASPPPETTPPAATPNGGKPKLQVIK